MLHSHNHSHSNTTPTSDGSTAKLSLAIVINLMLTVAQVVGGLLSGSLSLVADALHNLSDAGAILVAVVARSIGQKAASEQMTYGYKRAEIIGVLINSTMLIVVGIYLVYEAVIKYFNPTPIDGWIVFILAGLALVIDLATALLTYQAGAKDNMNIRAAFIHNLSDAMASVAVMVAGVLIINYQLYIVDVLATLLISAYVIYHGVMLLKKCILIIMQAVPTGIDLAELKKALEAIDEVDEIFHMHVWQMDETRLFFEGHAELNSEQSLQAKEKIRAVLLDDFNISHSTIETNR